MSGTVNKSYKRHIDYHLLIRVPLLGFLVGSHFFLIIKQYKIIWNLIKFIAVMC